MKQEQLNNGWFSVERKLPPLDEKGYRERHCFDSYNVLIFDSEKNRVLVGNYDYEERTWAVADCGQGYPAVLKRSKITHWRFIPKLPNTED